MINQENWNFAFFGQGPWRAQITFGAEADGSEIYFVSLLDSEFKDHYQRVFKELELALNDINLRYGHWSFNNPEQKSSEGCGSCQAH